LFLQTLFIINYETAINYIYIYFVAHILCWSKGDNLKLCELFRV